MDKLKPEVLKDLKTLAGKLDNWRELRRIRDELHRLTEQEELQRLRAERAEMELGEVDASVSRLTAELEKAEAERDAEKVVGHKTHWTPERGFWHTPLFESEAAEIIAACEANSMQRAKLMPTEEEAIRLHFESFQRLKELGWNDACYCPKDGSEFLALEPGSTGKHRCIYQGEWPDGTYWIGDCSSRPVLFKAIDKARIVPAGDGGSHE